MAKEEIKTKQLNLRVKDADQFYSNEIGINFNPNEIILDFKCITHIHDIGDHRGIMLKHLPVILSPFHAKSFLPIFIKAIEDYESKFGEIKKSEALKKAEKIVKKEKSSVVEKVKDKVENYFG